MSVVISNVLARQVYCVEFSVNGIPVRLGRHHDPAVYSLRVATSIAANGFADFRHSPTISLRADPAPLNAIWRFTSLLFGQVETKEDREAFESAVQKLRWDHELGKHMEALREWSVRVAEHRYASFRLNSAVERMTHIKGLVLSGFQFLVEIRFTNIEGKEVCFYSDFHRETPTKKELRNLRPRRTPARLIRTTIHTMAEVIADLEAQMLKDREAVAVWCSSAGSVRPVFPDEAPREEGAADLA